MPYSGLFSQINKFYDFPVNTTILAVVFCSIYGLLYVASTTAFNSIITSAVLYLVGSGTIFNLFFVLAMLTMSFAEHHVCRSSSYSSYSRA